MGILTRKAMLGLLIVTIVGFLAGSYFLDKHSIPLVLWCILPVFGIIYLIAYVRTLMASRQYTEDPVRRAAYRIQI